jgi:hypothetical protein
MLLICFQKSKTAVWGTKRSCGGLYGRGNCRKKEPNGYLVDQMFYEIKGIKTVKDVLGQLKIG